MATIYVDQQPYEANPQQNLLQVCLSLGFDLPYFCWHPALGSVGACRQCAVKQFRDADDSRGRLVMACLTPAQDGTRIAIDDMEAQAFRASVIEWLMTNHPHDCPVCDEGGECHLQDMTVMAGHTYRRYRFAKRTFRNQDLGPFINHEMNRCIQCYRCVRFYRDYAGGRDLNAFASHNHVYFGRHQDGVLENPFSGNLVEVCPTGVFTDKTLKQHYTRKWDLQTAPSLCVHCGVGCNTIAGERYGLLRRTLNRYNGQVNGYFLCDRGRFGYGFVNSPRRLRQPLRRRSPGSTAEPVSRRQALDAIAALLDNDRPVIGIGSPRASLEANFALRSLVGADRFYQGMSTTESHLLALLLDRLQHGPARTPSLQDAEQADAVLILGEDVANTAPRLALSLWQAVRQAPLQQAYQLGIPSWHDAAVREAIQQAKGPLFVATPTRTWLDEIATTTYRAAPDEIARLGFAVAHALDHSAPGVSDLTDELHLQVDAIAAALAAARRPLVVAGTSLGREAIVQAAANVAWTLEARGKAADLCYTVPECNSLGLGLLGGGELDDAFQAILDGEAETVIVLENDLFQHADTTRVHAILDTCPHLIVMDHLEHATTDRAEWVLPAATFAEANGTLVNQEGRAQRFFQVMLPSGASQASWRWLQDIMRMLDRNEAASWHNLDDVTAGLSKAMAVFTGLSQVAPEADFRIVGQKIPRQPHRYSGRTAMAADRNIHEPQPPTDPDTPFAFSMEGYAGRPPASLVPFFWSPGWNSVQATSKFQQEAGGPLQGGDPGLRLIEPTLEAKQPYGRQIPPAFRPRPGSWLLVPIYHIFGSEALSRVAPAIAERVPQPYVAVNAADAAELGIATTAEVDVTLDGTVYRLPVTLDQDVPRGIAGLPVGLAALPWPGRPVWGAISKVR